MKLILDRLEKPKERGGRIIARCPACAEIGKDTAADNLTIFENGIFACAVYQGDAEHSKRILQLAGDKSQIKREFTAAVYRPAPPREPPLPQLTPRQVQIILRCSERLGKSDQLCEGIAAKREWKPETVRHAAQDLSMGWITFDDDVSKPDATCPYSAPCFIYRAGIKVRFMGPDGKKTFRFLKSEGLNHKSLWRSGLITQDTKTVWITEGEPDALRLMDMGIGETEGNTEVVCSLPDAGYTIRRDEIELMHGCEVIFVPDADDVGLKAKRRLTETFCNAAISFSTVTL